MAHKIRKNKKAYTIPDIYKAYCSDNDAVEVPYERFRRILDAVNGNIQQRVLERSKCFKLPLGLGYICIVKYKPKQFNKQSLSPDYKSSKEEGMRIYHLNEHSGGYKYRLFWSKQHNTQPYRYKYQLSLTRTNKRYLAQLIFNKTDYINIDDLQVYKM